MKFTNTIWHWSIGTYTVCADFGMDSTEESTTTGKKQTQDVFLTAYQMK